VAPGSKAAQRLVEELAHLHGPLRPTELGSPWKLPVPESFTDGDHQDHIHVGFDSSPPAKTDDLWPNDDVRGHVSAHAAGARSKSEELDLQINRTGRFARIDTGDELGGRTGRFAPVGDKDTETALAHASGAGAHSSQGIRSRLLDNARAELGQREATWNDSPRITQYRAASGSPGPGPWCAYFVSWAAREAGFPLGDQGQGFGLVDAVYAWAQQSGRAVPVGTGTPRPGDLIVWDEHIGIVERVAQDGSIHTIEGNSGDSVARRVHPSGDALGYVRIG
jgi:CHAP domain